VPSGEELRVEPEAGIYQVGGRAMVKIRVGRWEAVINEGKWKASDPRLQEFLDGGPFYRGVIGHLPDPDLAEAQAALDALGFGEIIEADEWEEPEEPEEGVIYSGGE
jgi:hypothetical protein